MSAQFLPDLVSHWLTGITYLPEMDSLPNQPYGKS
jgi:hypothetical protein